MRKQLDDDFQNMQDI